MHADPSLPCFIIAWYQQILITSHSFTSLALGQSENKPNANEISLGDSDKTWRESNNRWWCTKTEQIQTIPCAYYIEYILVW